MLVENVPPGYPNDDGRMAADHKIPVTLNPGETHTDNKFVAVNNGSISVLAGNPIIANMPV